tara:strand:- start:108 stop:380 length:273 start_codon:yes stop_codon:yes gene_type:complete
MSNINEYLIDILTIDGKETLKTFASNHFEVIDLIVISKSIFEFNLITNTDTKESWNLKPGSLQKLRLLRNKIKNKDHIKLIENINEHQEC